MELFHNPASGQAEPEQPPAKQLKGEKKVMHILEGISEANDDGDLPPMEDRFSIEISHYEGEEPTSESLIEWWAKNQFRYPLLLQLARQYLAVPATSLIVISIVIKIFFFF